MKIIADLHIHSPFSRATSSGISIPNLVKYARMKGLHLLGTGDFTHPKWLEILKANLKEDGTGILKSEDGFNFLLSTEVSNIYTAGGKGRRIHNVILAPDFETVEQINSWLGSRGRLDYDGRPIFGFPAELVEKLKEISGDVEIIPAHVWTPWFSVFGSKSGFDSIEECYHEQSKHIHALETGLSSDPAMNWRLSKLDRYSLVSFSDSHSHWPWRIGREATVFEMNNIAYENVIRSMRTKEGLVETMEFFPEEGKYHYDGHRDCGISFDPKESMKKDSICPVCRKPLTIGVLHRIEELADRPEGFVPEGSRPFRSLVPLSEIISFVNGTQPFSNKVWEIYVTMLKTFGSEFNILLDAGKDEIEKAAGEKLADVIFSIRSGKAKMRPGYDGVYGKLIYGEEKRSPVKKPRPSLSPQKSLADF